MDENERWERATELVKSLNPCARLVNRTEDERGIVRWQVECSHNMVDGRCTRCGQTEEEPVPGSFSIPGGRLTLVPKRG